MASETPSAETAVPTLKVMRLQKPNLHMPAAGSMQSQSLIGAAMCLPDSFGVIHVGETFTAYLGALNVSKTLFVSNLTVVAQLQTPSQRWHLASTLDQGNSAGGVEISPGKGVDTIVSHPLEEIGQHILRVEVGYSTSDGTLKTLRKFYRFQVSNPFTINEQVFRADEKSCFVSVSIQNSQGGPTGGAVTICEAEFEAALDLAAEQLHAGENQHDILKSKKIGATLLDRSGRLEIGCVLRYVFKIFVSASAKSKGFAVGDDLGKFRFKWRKACGEMGMMASSTVHCPSFPVPLVDQRIGGESEILGGVGQHEKLIHTTGGDSTYAAINHKFDGSAASGLAHPVTVQALDSPACAQLGVPFEAQILVTNHSEEEMSLQLQFHVEHMRGITVCGSFRNQQDLHGRGGSAVVSVTFLPLAAGLLMLSGCAVVDLNHGVSFSQPPLAQILVGGPS